MTVSLFAVMSAVSRHIEAYLKFQYNEIVKKFQEVLFMAKKGENIFKRKDGRWEARYIKGHDLSGKIRYGFCYGKTYKEAKEKVTQVKASILNNTSVPTGRGQRLSAYCDEWLMMQKMQVKESTYVKYEMTLEKHIKPRLGTCLPAFMSAKVVEQFKKELLDECGLAPKTVKDILVVLHSILKYIAKQYPGILPVVEIIYPKEQKKEMRVLTVEEQKRLISYLMTDMDECRFGILLALLTGIRIGELCALRWEDVSLEDRTLRIASTMQRLKNDEPDSVSKTKILIGAPKSGSSLRTIPINEYAVSLCNKIGPGRPDTFLLTGTRQYMEPRVVQYRLSKYTAECGLDGVHFHTLRHTFATRCVEVGFEIKSLSEILGHANTNITLNRYVHSSMQLKRDNMDKLAASGLWE